MIPEDNEQGTRSAAKKNFTPRSDSEKANCLFGHIGPIMQNELQSKGQIARFWYFGWKEQSRKATESMGVDPSVDRGHFPLLFEVNGTPCVSSSLLFRG